MINKNTNNSGLLLLRSVHRCVNKIRALFVWSKMFSHI